MWGKPKSQVSPWEGGVVQTTHTLAIYQQGLVCNPITQGQIYGQMQQGQQALMNPGGITYLQWLPYHQPQQPHIEVIYEAETDTTYTIMHSGGLPVWITKWTCGTVETLQQGTDWEYDYLTEKVIFKNRETHHVESIAAPKEILDEDIYF